MKKIYQFKVKSTIAIAHESEEEARKEAQQMTDMWRGNENPIDGMIVGAKIGELIDTEEI